MALIVCSECGKKISDRAASCPDCGCPVDNVISEKVDESDKEEIQQQDEINNNIGEPEVSNPKKIIKKKTKIIIGSVIGVIVVGGILTFALSGNLRKYNSAEKLLQSKDYVGALEVYAELGDYKDAADRYKQCQFDYANSKFNNKQFSEAGELFKELGDYEDANSKYNECLYLQAKDFYDSEKYSEAASVFKQIPGYKDTDELLKDCEYLQTVDGQFMKALAKGLMARWELAGKDEREMTADEFVDNRKQLINLELDNVLDFTEKEFENKDLQKDAVEYIEALNKSFKSLDYYQMDYNKCITIWDEAYASRSLLLRKFAKTYNLKVDEEYQRELDDFINNAAVLDEQNALKETISNMISNLEFEKVEDSYDWKTYQVTITNETDETFTYFGLIVDLKTEDGTILASQYTNQINEFAPGAKGVFEFYTDKEFNEMNWYADYYVKQ